MINLKYIDETEAEALLGLLMLINDGRMQEIKDEGYKYKTSAQLKMLNAIFLITKYPSSGTRTSLAALLNMTVRSVQIWFQNMRQVIKDELNGRSREQFLNYKCYQTNSIQTKKHGKYVSYDIAPKKLIEIYLNINEKRYK